MKKNSRIDILFKPVSPESLTAFRIFFGLVMLWEVYRYFDKGWIERYWVKPELHFTYEWFTWVTPLSADGMIFLFYILGFLALCITISFMYRTSAALFFLIFTYTFLLEQTRYLNHFYLVILISFIMIFIPANRIWSIDSWLFQGKRENWIPHWPVLLLQFQIGIVYLFGGIAKLNMDWLTGSPMDAWLPRRSDFPVLGSWFELPETAIFASYSGLLIDLLAFPLLMIRKTRPWMAAVLVLFHLMNDRLFTIGIFPWFMIAALTIYLSPSWPKDLWNYLSRLSFNQKLFLFAMALSGAYFGAWFHEAISPVPILISLLITVILIWDFQKNPEAVHTMNTRPVESNKKWIAAALAFWCFLQVMIPMRHVLISGNPSWTEEGHRFAWHMKLRSKSCNEQFYVLHEETGELLEVHGMPFLENWQKRKVTTRPQLIIQYARFLSKIYDNRPVFADIECSLNGGPFRTLIDPEVDLTKVSFHDWKLNDWILR